MAFITGRENRVVIFHFSERLLPVINIMRVKAIMHHRVCKTVIQKFGKRKPVKIFIDIVIGIA
jgi:hypothetical protein